MEEAEAYDKLRTAGADWREAWNLLYRVRLERVAPQSRRKGNSYRQVEQALRDVGIEPEEIEFQAGTYGSREWVSGKRRL